MSRAAAIFPGRGASSSTPASPPAGHAWVRRAEQLRAEAGLPALTTSDVTRAARPAQAWPATFLLGLLDAERIAGDHDVVAVLAGSTGWYTALAASGVLDFDDAFRLVQQMAIAVEEPPDDDHAAAELIYPLCDATWAPVAERIEALFGALEEVDGDADVTLDLGSYVMIGGTDAAIDAIAVRLPAVTVGARSFPMRVGAADGWHTPLRAAAIEAAAERIGELRWSRPNVTLIDGRGARWTPWSTDPVQLAHYTLHELPLETYDYAGALRVALREYAPDVVLLPGPGSSLAAPTAQVVVIEGYHGLRSREAFEAAQAGSSPLLLSMRR